MVWAVLALVVAKKAKIERSEGIYILTEENYDKAVKENEYLLVYFYAPWFGFPPSFPPTSIPFLPPSLHPLISFSLHFSQWSVPMHK